MDIEVMIQDKKYDEVINLCQKLIEKNPNEGLLYYYIACCYDSLGLEKEAISYYQKAIELDLPKVDLQEAYLGLGSTYRILGRYHEAVDVLQKAIVLFPKYLPLQVFLSMSEYNLNHTKIAMQKLLNMLVTTTNDADIKKYQRAILYYVEDLDRIE